MNELSLRYGRDEDICYWYFLFETYNEMNIKPVYFCEKFNIPYRKFWNQIRLYRTTHPSPSVYRKYNDYYIKFCESDRTIREFTNNINIRMSTFDMWRRYFMTQERIEQLKNDDKLTKPSSLLYTGDN